MYGKPRSSGKKSKKKHKSKIGSYSVSSPSVSSASASRWKAASTPGKEESPKVDQPSGGASKRHETMEGVAAASPNPSVASLKPAKSAAKVFAPTIAQLPEESIHPDPSDGHVETGSTEADEVPFLDMEHPTVQTTPSGTKKNLKNNDGPVLGAPSSVNKNTSTPEQLNTSGMFGSLGKLFSTTKDDKSTAVDAPANVNDRRGSNAADTDLSVPGSSSYHSPQSKESPPSLQSNTNNEGVNEEDANEPKIADNKSEVTVHVFKEAEGDDDGGEWVQVT